MKRRKHSQKTRNRIGRAVARARGKTSGKEESNTRKNNTAKKVIGAVAIGAVAAGVAKKYASKKAKNSFTGIKRPPRALPTTGKGTLPQHRPVARRSKGKFTKRGQDPYQTYKPGTVGSKQILAPTPRKLKKNWRGVYK